MTLVEVLLTIVFVLNSWICVQSTYRIPSCDCGLEPSTRKCFDEIPRYYYDLQKERCLKFMWGGCEFFHLKNNFKTKSECERECMYGVSGPRMNTKTFIGRYNCRVAQICNKQNQNVPENGPVDEMSSIPKEPFVPSKIDYNEQKLAKSNQY